MAKNGTFQSIKCKKHLVREFQTFRMMQNISWQKINISCKEILKCYICWDKKFKCILKYLVQYFIYKYCKNTKSRIRLC